ncbi:phage portal protein [Acidaminobacter sp.]|uniref:phage portal protein n=1 Tax=Acidaminobacter sp. TaxID=1872102 RepID=UPI00255D37A5|nr:phage portal protein [Acidaminobacter sp.]MDK9712320.1 phage portal protein [Acidaminobacter sp.]
MGLFNYLISIFPPLKRAAYRSWYSNSRPILSDFGSNIYLSDFVNNAIDRVASEVSKIDVKSVVQNGNAIRVENDDITRLFRFKPNPLQTTSDFISSVEWLRRKNGNAFIYPQFENVMTADGRTFRRYVALYPLNPNAVYIGTINGEPWEIKFDFIDGSSYTLPYADLIHLRWRRGTNLTAGGGDDSGQINNYDITRTINALDKVIQGLPKSIEASLQIKGVYAAKTLADQNKLTKMITDFESHIHSTSSGIVATDLAGEFTPVNVSPANVPETALNFLKSIIRERYGISAAIISGDYTGDQHSAFYQTVIEDFIVQFEQAATACLFSGREQDVGHRIKCYYSKVNYMATKDKLELANLAKETGIMNLNEINEMFGLQPFEDGDRRLQSLNYVSLKVIDEYQKSKSGASAGGAEGEK